MASKFLAISLFEKLFSLICDRRKRVFRLARDRGDSVHALMHNDGSLYSIYHTLRSVSSQFSS